MTDATPLLAADAPPPPAWTAPVRALAPLLIALAVAAVLAGVVLPHVSTYHGNEVADCGIAIMLAVSLTVVNGFTGQFSIGHSGFLALGGYAAAALLYYGSYHWFGDAADHGGRLSGTLGGRWLTRGDALFLGAILAGGIVSAAVGWVVGLPSLRLRGDYLAIVTLGFCEIVRVVIQSSGTQLAPDPAGVTPGLLDPADDPDSPVARTAADQLTHLGGALGFTTVPTYATVFWIATATVLTVLLVVRLKYSAYGRAMLSVREDDVAAQATGVNITRYKVRAFVFAAFFAGIAGGLFATRHGVINSGELGFQRSFDYVIMVVLGGLGSVSGATIAAVLLTLLPEWLRDLDGIAPWKLGAACIALAVVGLVAGFRRRWVVLGICAAWELMLDSYLYFHAHGYPKLNLSDYRMVMYALVLITVMLTRPQGLLGLREVWGLVAAWKSEGPRPKTQSMIQ